MAATTRRTRVRRVPARGVYERETIEAILDEALVCHVGFTGDDGQPFVIPTLHARIGDLLYLHGSAASRMLRTLEQGVAVCVTATLVDGLVLARSAFHHSINYRSVVVLGQARLVEPKEERLRALELFTEKLVPGRWAEVRGPSAQELKGDEGARAGARRGVGEGAQRPARGRRAGLRAAGLGRGGPAEHGERRPGGRSAACGRHSGAAPRGLLAALIGPRRVATVAP